MHIELIERENKLEWPYYTLVIDGQKIPNTGFDGKVRYYAWSFEVRDRSGSRIPDKISNDLTIVDPDLSVEILKFPPEALKFYSFHKIVIKFPTKLQLFEGIPVPYPPYSKRDTVNFVWRDGTQTDPYCYFFFDFDSKNWAKPYSYQDYKGYLREEMRSVGRKLKFYFSNTIDRNKDSVRFQLDPKEPIGVQIDVFAKLLIKANQRANKKLEKDYTQVSLREFDFPAQVKTSCEQYLMYFADFLKDLGISAVANIHHDENGKTLFNIKPENSEVALSAIREALELYLELPMSPLVDEPTSDSKMLMVQAEINSLRMRLNFAEVRSNELEQRTNLQVELIESHKETIKAKDEHLAILQNHQNAIFQPGIVAQSAIQPDYVDGEVVTEETTTPSNKEIDMGLVTMKPVKIGGGVEFNTPRLSRLGIKKGKELFDYLDKRFNEK